MYAVSQFSVTTSARTSIPIRTTLTTPKTENPELVSSGALELWMWGSTCGACSTRAVMHVAHLEAFITVRTFDIDC